MPAQKMKTYGLVSLVIGVLGSAGIAGAEDCKPKHTFATVTPGTVTVAVVTYPPHSYVENGAISGIDGDIIKEFAKRECLTVKPIVVDPAAAAQSILSGQADVSTGAWYRSAERAKVMGLSAPLYTDQMAIYSKSGYNKVEDLVGKNVGAVQGYLWIADLKALLGSSLKLYANSVSMQQDLFAGRIDVATDGLSTGVTAERKGALKDIKVAAALPDPRVKATEEAAQAGFPYRIKATDFGSAVDADIADMHKDGTIVNILKAYGLSESAAQTGAPRLLK